MENYKQGTTLKGKGINLVLEDIECITPPGSCGEDEWLLHWVTPQGRSHITTDTELAGLLSDGATIGGVE
jgi:hypothetical protein